MNLDAARHEALCRPTTKASDTFLFTTNAPPKALTQSNRRAIIEHTRARYSQQPKAQPRPAPEPRPDREPASPPAAEVHKQTPKAQETTQEWRLFKKPSKAAPKVFATAQEKILHYVGLADYLTTPQIIKLCYGHLSHNPASQKVSASNDLKKLIEKKSLKELSDRRPKIYHVGSKPNVTAHNLALRDLFVKIELSNFEISKIDFSAQLGKLNPDLRVVFATGDGNDLQTFWEFDTGTESLAELMSKVQRYEKAKPDESPVIFVFESETRLKQARQVLIAPFCIFAVLSDFAVLTDPSFYFSNTGEQNNPQPLFG